MRAAVIAIAVGAVVAAPAAADTPQQIRFHGGAYDRASVIATDAGGNSYVAGYSESQGKDSFVVVKLGPDGAVRWTARYDGSRGGVGGQADALAVDAAGNVYAAGFIHDGVMFAQNYDYLVVKLGLDGTQHWAHRYNGPGNVYDFARAIAVDGAGNVYVTGFSHGEAFGYDWATLKLSPTGALLWERRVSGPGQSDDRASELALLHSGNLLVAGVSQTGGEQLPDNDVELIAYDPQGTVVWQRRWSDTAISHEIVSDLDTDGSGRIAITGTTQENPGPYAPPFPLTQRYDSGGTLLQTIRSDGGSSVDVDAAGTFYVAGTFVTSPSSVAKFSAAGARVWSTPLTVGAGDALRMPVVAADSAGAVTVAGTVSDTSTGQGDWLTIRYGADGRELWRYRFSGVPDPGGSDQVADVAIDSAGAALVTGTSWNGYGSLGGTAEDIVTLKFAAGAAPALVAPSGLGATGISASQIRLTWQDKAGTEEGFRIERCAGLGCGSFSQVAVVGNDVTSYVDGAWPVTARTRIACARSTRAVSRRTRTSRARRCGASDEPDPSARRIPGCGLRCPTSRYWPVSGRVTPTPPRRSYGASRAACSGSR